MGRKPGDPWKIEGKPGKSQRFGILGGALVENLEILSNFWGINPFFGRPIVKLSKFKPHTQHL